METEPRLRTQHHAEYSLVSLRGEFDVASRAAVRDVLHGALISTPGDAVLVDLTRVAFLDCTIVGVLVRAHQEATRLGMRLVLFGPTGPVQRLLALSQIDRTITTRPHLYAALSMSMTAPDLGNADSWSA
jgi:anti-anti-sigma factor